MTRLIVGPFNRVEGDLEVALDIRDGRVARAEVNAPLYRGFERMLEGRDPRDALVITPRICGICSISQSAAAARALAAAMGLNPTPAGAEMAALIHAAENAADHLTHFHLFFMPDFARPAYAGRPWHARAVARFTAIDGSAQRTAIAARAELLHVMGLLAGKWPHTLAIQPGGVTRTPGLREKARLATTLRAFRRYLETTLFGAPVEEFVALSSPAALIGWGKGDAGLFLEIADDLALGDLGRGGGRYLSFGAYPLVEGPVFAAGVWEGGVLSPLDPAAILEDTSHAWMTGPAAHPFAGETQPDETMAAPGYSWCKAPRLAGRPAEVGALARMVVDGHPLALALALAGGGVLARVAARLLELARTQIEMERLVAGIEPAAHFMAQGRSPRAGRGAGLVEAARGALGHWLRIENGRIAGYQIIAPTTWNFSPRDAAGQPGPLEAALEGLAVEGEVPLAVQHVVRSFDPCMVCTVH
ncbi:MAG: nickel-dependent hydrogenase large subunit [Rhodobacteraceae bacterium]|jgi:Ni,Fe-hydrogenase I large subunit|nr:nickel-dependent hydrogenase large subunit [Paracoccaceae bacterium]